MVDLSEVQITICFNFLTEKVTENFPFSITRVSGLVRSKHETGWGYLPIFQAQDIGCD